MKNPQKCRNCLNISDLDETQWVKPGYRFCQICFDKMKSIGQIVEEYRVDDGTHILMWDGDPFYSRKRSNLPSAIERYIGRKPF